MLGFGENLCLLLSLEWDLPFSARLALKVPEAAMGARETRRSSGSKNILKRKHHMKHDYLFAYLPIYLFISYPSIYLSLMSASFFQSPASIRRASHFFLYLCVYVFKHCIFPTAIPHLMAEIREGKRMS